MKTKTTKAMMLLVMLIAVKCGSAQNVFSSQSVDFTTLPPTPAPEALRVKNGLISHLVNGTVGNFGSSDQWIGIGQPLSTLYGNRIQWNGQAFIQALRDNGVTGDKDAIT